jgi:hypothetical protein
MAPNCAKHPLSTFDFFALPVVLHRHEFQIPSNRFDSK